MTVGVIISKSWKLESSLNNSVTGISKKSKLIQRGFLLLYRSKKSKVARNGNNDVETAPCVVLIFEWYEATRGQSLLQVNMKLTLLIAQEYYEIAYPKPRESLRNRGTKVAREYDILYEMKYYVDFFMVRVGFCLE